MARIREIVIDAINPPALARFWAAALDDHALRPYDEAEVARLAKIGRTPETDPTVAVDGPGFTLFFQETTAPKAGRNRLHFDLAGGPRASEVDRLCALGATLREQRETYSVLQDPEGNEFCVRDPDKGVPPGSIDSARQAFAEQIQALTGLRSDGLMRGLASVPREEFVGPGPWHLVRPSELARGYVATPDADPRRLYDNVLVALDARRHLNNGEPAALARWLDCLDLAPGDRLLHIGCGVGYYTAVAAEAIMPGGRAVGVEIDPELAERARRNLRRWQDVTVVCGDGAQPHGDAFDAIFVNAGATEPLAVWLDALRDEGRLLLPLTVGLPERSSGVGHMLLVRRHSDAYSAGFVSPVGIFHCNGARTNEGDNLLRSAYQNGGHEGVRSLRRDEHPSAPDCWLHAGRFCLSRLGLSSAPSGRVR